MTRNTQRSGLALVLFGLLGALFFWVTDPHYGPSMHRSPQTMGHVDPRYVLFLLRGSPDNPVDSANEAWFSTIVGVAGSSAMIVVGLWLWARRKV